MAEFDAAAVDMADQAWMKEGPAENQSAKSPDGCLPITFWNELGTITPPDRLVRNLLGTTTLALVYGEPASGKTFFVFDLGVHIALGRAWFDRAVTGGAVLYVACEGYAGLNNRIAAFRQTHDLPNDVPFAVVRTAINLGPGGEDAERVIQAAENLRRRYDQTVQLIVVDTLARAMGDGDENTAKDMNAFVKACDRIRVATEATVLIVHHSGKTKQSGARGSSALLGAVDTAIEVTKESNGARTAKVIKQKDGADGVTLGFALQIVVIGRDDDDEVITSCIVQLSGEVAKPALSDQQQRALAVLRQVLAAHGEKPPDDGGFPDDVMVVAVDRFREALKTEGVTDRDKPSNERSQWKRIKEKLCEDSLMVIQDDFCWVT